MWWFEEYIKIVIECCSRYDVRDKAKSKISSAKSMAKQTIKYSAADMPGQILAELMGSDKRCNQERPY